MSHGDVSPDSLNSQERFSRLTCYTGMPLLTRLAHSLYLNCFEAKNQTLYIGTSKMSILDNVDVDSIASELESNFIIVVNDNGSIVI